MSLTDGLAILGAATGMTGTALGVMSYRRDRARLKVKTWVARSRIREDDLYLWVRIHNAGRQPAKLVQIMALRGRFLGLGWLLPLLRFELPKRILGKAGRLDEIGTFLDSIVGGPTELAPNDEWDARLRGATRLDAGEPRGRTYILAVTVTESIIVKRVTGCQDVAAWVSD
jgi:hypothetical protein